MSDTATMEAPVWDDTMLLLGQESRDCGLLLLQLAQLESQRAPSRRKSVWCMGRGGRSRRYDRFTWHYYTRRSRHD